MFSVGRGIRQHLGWLNRRPFYSKPEWYLACKHALPDHDCPETCLCDISNEAATASWPSDKKVDYVEIAEYGNREPTPMRIQEVLAMKDPQETLDLLRNEQLVRFANRIAHMHDLDDCDGVMPLMCERARLVRSFLDVSNAATRGSCPEDFAAVVKTVRIRHKQQIKRLTNGMSKLKTLKLEQGQDEQQVTQDIDAFINRFVLSKIGMEMLNAQYLGLFTSSKSIVNPQCDPCEIAKLAAANVRKIAAAEFGTRNLPEVQVSFHGLEKARTLPLVSSYLMYILMELLKNSFRAVVELHRKSSDPSSPIDPILIRVSSDDDQVVLDIFDRGGGIPFEHQQHIWSYTYSTKRWNPKSSTDWSRTEATPLAGFGVGLPLSRLYAEYLGGSLHLMTLPNFGTHAFLYLHRCSSRKEGMPTYVNWIRKRNLIHLITDLEKRKRLAAEEEDYAEALRLKSLTTEAREKLAQLGRASA